MILVHSRKSVNNIPHYFSTMKIGASKRQTRLIIKSYCYMDSKCTWFLARRVGGHKVLTATMRRHGTFCILAQEAGERGGSMVTNKEQVTHYCPILGRPFHFHIPIRICFDYAPSLPQ